jgi:hypothetical protein
MRRFSVADETVRGPLLGHNVAAAVPWEERMKQIAWLGLVFLLLLAVFPAAAQESAPPEWQATVTGQIEAFRADDAEAALGFAATAFHENFPTGEAFMQAVRNWGYEPIIESRSHSFGPFQEVSETVVVQQVRLTGPDSVLYEALYQLIKEPAGWRIAGVQMVKTAGMSA